MVDCQSKVIGIRILHRWQNFLGAAAFCIGCSSRHRPPVDTHSELRHLEQAIHDEINRVRLQHGLSKIKFDHDLKTVARSHSQDMGRRDYFAHDSPDGRSMTDRYEAAGYRCRVPSDGNSYLAGAENIFMANQYSQYRVFADGSEEGVDPLSVKTLATQVVDGWMNSPGHRYNILLADWRREGIGVYIDQDWEVYVTQNFC